MLLSIAEIVYSVLFAVIGGLETFLTQGLLPDAMFALASALVIITIAISIFLVDRDFSFQFDRAVLLNKVIKVHRLVYAIALLFFPFFLWDVATNLPEIWAAAVSSVLFVLYAVGVALFGSFYWRMYRWMVELEPENEMAPDSYRTKQRLNYLRDSTGHSQHQIAWQIVWEIENKPRRFERECVKELTTIVGGLVEKDQYVRATEYLSYYKKNIESKERVDLDLPEVYDELLRRLLEWHRKACKELEDNSDKRRGELDFLGTVRSLIRKLIANGFDINRAYKLRDALKRFLNEIKGDADYLKRFFQEMIDASKFLTSAGESGERLLFWEETFPKEWKITKNSLQDKTNPIPSLWLYVYGKWFLDRRREQGRTEGSYDRVVDTVTKGLFPTVEPTTWLLLLDFLFGDYSGPDPIADKVRCFLERESRFGALGRVYGGRWTDEESTLEEKIQEERREALELASFVFPNEWSGFPRELSREKVDKYVAVLQDPGTASNPNEDRRRKELLGILQEIQQLLDGGSGGTPR
ncbi:MAG: hypothetical protein ACLFV4_07465 [Candidatus Hydrogenedentota bacterium]